MINVIGIRFREGGKVYFFDPGDLTPAQGDAVIADTARGIEFGTVASVMRQVDEEKIQQPVKKLIRMATPEDVTTAAENREKEKEALRVCREKIMDHELEMKLVGCEYAFDRSKLLFYFTADGRIDFRDLVKDLASVFRTRIELRQIGVRDETKMIGGIGVCGRPLCCTTYLSDFSPVSIKMAKEQGLSLNPTKISGVCGRLMCCLNNEEATYEDLNSKLPGKGDMVTTPEGETGKVTSLNVLRQKVRIVVEINEDEKEVREYDASELTFKPRKKKEKKNKDKEDQNKKENKEGEKEQGEKKEGKKRRHRGKNKKEAPADGQE